jgi:hypothetical protein
MRLLFVLLSGERAGNGSLRWIVVLVQHDSISLSLSPSLFLSLFINAHWKFEAYRGGEREKDLIHINSFHIHILEHEDNVVYVLFEKEIELIFFWYNIEDINDWDLKLLFFFFYTLYEQQFVSILIRVASHLILMQYMHAYICMVNYVWMNESI